MTSVCKWTGQSRQSWPEQSIKPQKKAGRESFIFKYIVVITITKKIAMGITTFF